MQVSSTVTEVMADLATILAKPSVQETAVSKVRLLEQAKWMTERRGYIHTERTLAALESYIRGYGLYLYGDVGTGKTSFFRCVGTAGIRFFNILRHMATPLERIDEMINGFRNDELVIDDIGSEPVYNNYGSRIDLLPWIVEVRFESPKRTHFTTNLSGDAITERYGARLVDRIKEMCKCHRFDGQSQRKPKPKASTPPNSNENTGLSHLKPKEDKLYP